MKITPAEYAELAEWSDRMTAEAAALLNRGQGDNKTRVRKLIDEWVERFEDKSYKAQTDLGDANRLAYHYSRRNPVPPGGACQKSLGLVEPITGE
ncbi:hypothetical protein KKF82_04265 [Patescibacteria group bacterium]|nr:hypothetical protein [Patescibacteria group bacterium]